MVIITSSLETSISFIIFIFLHNPKNICRRLSGRCSKSKPQNDHVKHSSHSPPQYKLHSLKLLTFDKERLERKITEYKRNRREVPPDLLQQHREVSHRIHWQAAQLERASPSMLAEYEKVLHRLVQGLGDGVKKYSSQGNREAAKDALGRMKLVENEMESLRRRRTL
ncbi:hypothetical protein AGOR_G00197860 [Albula goreensis]|uniref:Uncharacterized protein n=1 Tax=Albula goreensis TaxID=1534307 RepID=A0A8T3CSD0_9TELE|nr:hypothetical protein AGOR_G00197860 [Albula goreensis]